MLVIGEHWHGSDLGRQRQGNEDSYFVRAPLFVVADGMGGARAGEVASGMAVESFDRGLPDGAPSDGLVTIIEDANRRIHERSREDAQRAGMGTTVTAAYVGERDVTVAHVGDSRAYVLRDGDLIRLTRDHSLVAELVARGKITEEQAESHPQRSVITRALGPEADVQVDVQTYHARPGDVFLLCSDGLTSMISEARVKELVEGASSLERAGRELIGAANEAGGRDNITVVLFRLRQHGDGDGRQVAAPGETAEYETWEGEAVAPKGVGRPDASDAAEAEYRRTGTMALSAVEPARQNATAGRRPSAEPLPEGEEAGPPVRTAPLPRQGRKRRLRVPGALLAFLAVLAIVAVGAWTASRAVYFIGVDEQTNIVTIYRGLPYELPFGIDLYERWYTSGVALSQVPPARRERFTGHELRSKDDAEDAVRALERGQIE